MCRQATAEKAFQEKKSKFKLCEAQSPASKRSQIHSPVLCQLAFLFVDSGTRHTTCEASRRCSGTANSNARPVTYC